MGGPRLWIALAAVLSACVPTVQGGRQFAQIPDPTEEERQLQRQATAFQKTVVQGVAAGLLVGGIGGRGVGGVIVAVPPGALTGTYVGSLQRRYATEEDRLAKLRADLDAANAELAGALRTMETVQRRQSASLAAARARPPGLSDAPQEVADACANTFNMERIEEGAQSRLGEFEEAGRLVGGLGEATPAQQRTMTRRILTMGQIVAAARAESPTCAFR
jgi:hypothetical protein